MISCKFNRVKQINYYPPKIVSITAKTTVANKNA